MSATAKPRTPARASTPGAPGGAAVAASPRGAVTVPGARPGALAAAGAQGRRSTPAVLRAWSVVLVLVGLVVGAVGVLTFVGADQALRRADANAAQLVRVQDVQTSLVSADAQVTNAFLAGGLEGAERRAAYTAATQNAVRQLTAAARAQPADEKVLADLATQVQEYTGTIELARANNRQALPVGAQYLKNASAGLRADALPALTALTDANDTRVTAELDAARSTWPISLAGWGGLALLVAASVVVARRTHRILNVPVVVGGVALLVYLVAAASASATLGSHVRDVQSQYTQTRALAAARIAAFDAKSNESLTLVARGSGAAFEAAWQASSTTVTEQLGEAGSTGGVGAADVDNAWGAYTERHTALRALDDGGDWDGAVALATTDAADGTTATFADFDAASATWLEAASGQVSTTLADARGPLLGFAAAGGVVGLLVAALGWRGLGRRIEEYR